MSGKESMIVCRRCQETIRLEDENCPNCGKSIRSTPYLIAGFVLGLVIAIASVPDLGQRGVFGLLGVAIMVTTAYLVYDKRKRMGQSDEADSDAVDMLSDDDVDVQRR